MLGMGNSAMDIAVDASYHARRTTYLAARRGAYIVPKYIFGKPMDQIGRPTTCRRDPLPADAAGCSDRRSGKMSDYGLPEPDHKFGHAHPTVSGRILDRLAHGAITPKPNIAALDGDTVRFVDGSEVHADLVVYCTGYKITFPFFDEDFVARRATTSCGSTGACSTPSIDRPLLPRPGPAARGDHADRRAPGRR